MRPGVLVGLCHERSAANIAAALAILKAGGGYVGLDPSYPAARIEYMLRDAQVAVLVAQAAVIERLSPLACGVVELEKDTSSFGNRTEPPEDLACPVDVMYAIYTSGSTGQPKGVLVSHANVNGLIDSAPRSVRIDRRGPHVGARQPRVRRFGVGDLAVAGRRCERARP